MTSEEQRSNNTKSKGRTEDEGEEETYHLETFDTEIAEELGKYLRVRFGQ